MFEGQVIGIYGNHDVRENSLRPDDSISIIAEAGRITLLDGDHLYRGIIGGRRVVVGGTSWGQHLPEGCSSGELFEEDRPIGNLADPSRRRSTRVTKIRRTSNRASCPVSISSLTDTSTVASRASRPAARCG